MVVHWTRVGNRRALTRRALPMGDKHRITYKERRMEPESKVTQAVQQDVLKIPDGTTHVTQRMNTVQRRCQFLQKRNHDRRPATTFINLACVDRQRHSPLVGADGDATRGPGIKTSWTAYMHTETRLLYNPSGSVTSACRTYLLTFPSSCAFNLGARAPSGWKISSWTSCCERQLWSAIKNHSVLHWYDLCFPFMGHVSEYTVLIFPDDCKNNSYFLVVISMSSEKEQTLYVFSVGRILEGCVRCCCCQMKIILLFSKNSTIPGQSLRLITDYCNCL